MHIECVCVHTAHIHTPSTHVRTHARTHTRTHTHPPTTHTHTPHTYTHRLHTYAHTPPTHTVCFTKRSKIAPVRQSQKNTERMSDPPVKYSVVVLTMAQIAISDSFKWEVAKVAEHTFAVFTTLSGRLCRFHFFFLSFYIHFIIPLGDEYFRWWYGYVQRMLPYGTVISYYAFMQYF